MRRKTRTLLRITVATATALTALSLLGHYRRPIQPAAVSVEFLTIPNKPNWLTQATGVNRDGDTVGVAGTSASGGWHGFIAHGDRVSLLSHPRGVTDVTARTLNDRDEIVGTATRGKTTIAVVWRNETPRTLAMNVHGVGINNQGIIVGGAYSNDVWTALRWTGNEKGETLGPSGRSRSSTTV